MRRVTMFASTLLVGTALLAPLPASAQTTAGLEKEVVISATGGAFGQALKTNFYDPFEKATGVKVIKVDTEYAEQFAKLRAGVESGRVEYDVVYAGLADLIEKRDILAPIDCSAMKNLKEHGVEGACTGWGVIRTVGGNLLAYNAKEFPNKKPKTYADLFDVKGFPGPRALPDTGDRDWSLATIALLADGVTADKLWPLDLDRAYRKLDTIKPHVTLWYKSSDQLMQALRSGEVAMTFMPSGRVVALQKEGFPIELSWAQSIRDVGLWAIAKNAPHPKAAFAFIDFFLANPPAHIALSNLLNYDTGNRSSIELVPEAERPNRLTYPANFSQQIVPDYEWISANRNMLRERFTTWLAK